MGHFLLLVARTGDDDDWDVEMRFGGLGGGNDSWIVHEQAAWWILPCEQKFWAKRAVANCTALGD